jgi:hypothetical protein
LAAAAVIGASAGAHTQQVVLPPAHVSTSALVKKILASHGIDPKGVVVQHGVWNYAGPTCPGIGWTCTTAKRVIQFSARASNNQFQCSPSNSFGGSANPPDQCEIVQVSTDGNNTARCYERSQTSGVSQSCVIFQTSTTGTNHLEVLQQVDVHGGASQDATQYAGTNQQSDSGRNDAHIQQQINEDTHDAGPGGAQTQHGSQSVSVEQYSDTGDNSADVHQSLALQEQINGPSRGTVVVNQKQDATDTEPNTNAGIVQHSSSGENNAHLNQSHDLSAQAPNNATGSQTQGTQDGGINGHFDQLSTGLSINHGEQHEHQRLDPIHAAAGLSQTQWGPMWMGSPQGTNPNDQYNVNQLSDQHASNSAFQEDDAFGNCDTSGNCDIDQRINQNGNSQTNSCSGPSCHIGLFVSSGQGEGNGTDTCSGQIEEETGNCPEPPGPPPPPPPPSD